MSEKRGFSQRWGHLLLGGLIRDDATDIRNSAFRTLLDTHNAALRASQGGEVRVRFGVDAEGTPVDPEVQESSGSTAR